MFELRWLETRTNTCGVEGCNEESCKGTIKVLQFRQFVAGVDEGEVLPVCGGEWSEWQDIPIEKST